MLIDRSPQTGFDAIGDALLGVFIGMVVGLVASIAALLALPRRRGVVIIVEVIALALLLVALFIRQQMQG